MKVATFLSALLVVLSFSCKDTEAIDETPSAEEVPVEPEIKELSSAVSPRRILGSPLVVPMPRGWIFDRARPAASKDDPTVDPDAPIRLRSHTLFSARAEKKPGAAWLLVMHDNNLGANATASEYLDAQRASNRQTVVNIKHVDAERSTLDGRPTYRVRDEWELNNEVYVQDSLLILDAPKSSPTKDGYVVVLTQLKSEAESRKKLVQNVFAGIDIDLNQ